MHQVFWNLQVEIMAVSGALFYTGDTAKASEQRFCDFVGVSLETDAMKVIQLTVSIQLRSIK